MPRAMVRLTTGKRLELQKRFATVDKSGDRKLDFAEMKALLLQGNPDLEDRSLKQLFRRVDKNNDGSVDFDEFVNYLYNAPPVYQQAPQECIDKFLEFAGESMDGSEFSKFCIDCKLIEKGFRKEDIATTFAQVCPRGKRKITTQTGADGFSQYDKLLSLLAEKKKVPVPDIFRAVIGGEKSSSGTKADAVRFHDDKTLYTGSHGANEAHGRAGAEASSPKAAREKFDIGSEGDWSGCEETFRKFDDDQAGLGARDFSKLCQDAGLCDSHFSRGDADIIFTKLRQRKLDFEHFQEALRLVAERKKESIRDVQAVVTRCSGPVVNATVADAVRFHDDKESYTGMHAGK